MSNGFRICNLPGMRIDLAAQLIVELANRDTILYNECLASVSNTNGEKISNQQYFDKILNRKNAEIHDTKMLITILRILRESEHISLGYNISPKTITRAYSQTLNILRQFDDVSHRLIVEVTEGAPELHDTSTAKFVRELQAMDIRVAIDDLGSQFATPDVLDKIDFDIIKIDKKYLRGRETAPHALGDGARLVKLAKNRAETVIVEGVETLADLNITKEWGATHAQGYFLGGPRPMDPTANCYIQPPKKTFRTDI